MGELLNARMRPIITGVLVGVMAFGLLVQVVHGAYSGNPVDLKDPVIGAAGVALGWYFGKRDAVREAEANGEPTQQH